VLIGREGWIMKMTVLRYSGSDQTLQISGERMQYGPCGFLVNDSRLIDASAIGSNLRIDSHPVFTDGNLQLARMALRPRYKGALWELIHNNLVPAHTTTEL
jgi:hypothetical protein